MHSMGRSRLTVLITATLLFETYGATLPLQTAAPIVQPGTASSENLIHLQKNPFFSKDFAFMKSNASFNNINLKSNTFLGSTTASVNQPVTMDLLHDDALKSNLMQPNTIAEKPTLNLKNNPFFNDNFTALKPNSTLNTHLPNLKSNPFLEPSVKGDQSASLNAVPNHQFLPFIEPLELKFNPPEEKNFPVRPNISPKNYINLANNPFLKSFLKSNKSAPLVEQPLSTYIPLKSETELLEHDHINATSFPGRPNLTPSKNYVDIEKNPFLHSTSKPPEQVAFLATKEPKFEYVPSLANPVEFTSKVKEPPVAVTQAPVFLNTVSYRFLIL